MSKLYYGNEVKDLLKETLADEISEIIFQEGGDQDDAETKLSIIKGMFILAATLDETLTEKEEDE